MAFPRKLYPIDHRGKCRSSALSNDEWRTTRLVHRLFFFVVDGLRGLGLEVRGPRCCAELLEPYGQRVADGGVQA